MQVIAWLLIGTVILAYICEFLKLYGHFLLVLTGEGLLGVLALLVVVLLMRAAWSWFSHWRELRQVRIRADRAARRENAHYQRSRAEMEQLARAYHIRKGLHQ